MQSCDRAENTQHEGILRVLDRLLYDAHIREAFVAHGPRCPELGWDDAVARAFEHVDVRELAQVGRNIRNDVVSGGGTGTGLGLARTFPRTLSVVRECTGDDVRTVAEEFIASAAFQDFRDIPYSPRGRGRTLPECFYRWLASGPSHDSDAATEPLAYHEAAEAVVRTVAAGGDATFDVTLPGAKLHGGILCLFRDYTNTPPEWGLTSTMYLAGASRCLVGPTTATVFAALTTVLDGDTAELDGRVRSTLELRLQSWGMR